MSVVLSKHRVLVIGDAMLDEYIHGTATRISPEAPVPIMLEKSHTYNLGGASNVAANITSLGGDASLIGVVGSNDKEGVRLGSLCIQHHIDVYGLLMVSDRSTTVKTRIIANMQQIARIDRENSHKLQLSDENEVILRLRYLLSECVAVIISDYAKGVVSDKVFHETVNTAYALETCVFIDPKIANLPLYLASSDRNITCYTPNLSEAEAFSGVKITDLASLEASGSLLLNLFGSQYVLITRGNGGMSLFEAKTGIISHFPTRAKAVFDVSGAGDTVIAALALAYANGMTMQSAVVFANAAAGVVVSKQGTATVTQEEIQDDEQFSRLTKLHYPCILME